MAKTRALRTAVTVVGDDGQPHFYEAGDTPPAADAAKIDNPKAWDDFDPSEDRQYLAINSPVAEAGTIAGFGGDVERGGPTQLRDAGARGKPEGRRTRRRRAEDPRQRAEISGPFADLNKDQLKELADENGVEVTTRMSKPEIVQALEDAGVDAPGSQE